MCPPRRGPIGLTGLLPVLLGAGPLRAQLPTLPAPPSVLRPASADTGRFAPVPLPPPTAFRRADGRPGVAYWQQRVDYRLRVVLDTSRHRLDGTASIGYTNNSPDTLTRLWLQLDQNLFRSGSTGSALVPPENRFGGRGFAGGIEIGRVALGSSTGRGRGGEPGAQPIAWRVEDTRMRVDLPRPLAPHGTVRLDIDYGFDVPTHGADRMGRDGRLYEIAQWFPRVSVYDDIRGWNTAPYLGRGEFYLEYGDIEYQVTLPAGYIVAGSGTLENPTEVLTPRQRLRLAAAVRSDTISHIVTEEELASGSARPSQVGTLTWRFKAVNVRDVAWAASPAYLWDATGWRGILVQAFYRPSALPVWQHAADMSRFSIREYSTRWFHYPYPQISAVEGPVFGMEYPMLAMEGVAESREDLYNVVTHEIGHMWFPMIVGSDERTHAWMDEGLTMFMNTFSEEEYFRRNDAEARRAQRTFVLANDQLTTAQPILTPPDRFQTDTNLGSLAYFKPALALRFLREKVLSPEVFDEALREYTARWAFKHPQPADFFRTIEDVSGRRLDWFWRGWFFTTAALDQAVESVTNEAGAVTVVLTNPGQQVAPAEIQLTFADGTTLRLRYPVEIWYRGDRYAARVATDKVVVAVALNPDGLVPDIHPGNDSWQAVSGTGP